MQEKLHQLKDILAEVSDLQAASLVLEWDQQTYMPPGGITATGKPNRNPEQSGALKVCI